MITLTTEQAQQIEQAEQEPVGYIDAGDLRELSNGNERQYSLFAEDKGRMIAIYAAPQPMKQEPVAVYLGHTASMGNVFRLEKQIPVGTKLYAAPIRTKDLTDDEIHDVFKSLGFSLADPRTEDFSVARAVIAAYKEKNNVK